MTYQKAWAGAQIVGGRSYQEDAFEVLTVDQDHGPMLCLLADGMGGHAAGDVAARLAIENFRKTIIESAKPGQSCHDDFLGALDHANRAIASHTSSHPDTEGMGCTFIAAEILGCDVRWLSVGDSLIYSVGPDGITRLNADHSMASRVDAAARRGEITWEEARNSPSRNVLLSAVTGDAISRVDRPREPVILSQDHWLIIASDGLDSLSTDEILAVIYNNSNAGDPETICHALLDAVTKAGRERQDNTTVIVARPFSQNAAKNDDTLSVNTDDVVTRPISVGTQKRSAH